MVRSSASRVARSSHSLSRIGLVLTTLILSSLGLLFIFDASVAESFALFNTKYYFLTQQALYLGVGLVGMTVAQYIPTMLWKKLAPVGYIISILLLILVFVPGIGRELNGAHRWLFLGSLRFQPIEPIKFALVVFFASWMSQHQRLLPFLATVSLPTFLIIMQPDLGSLLVTLFIAVSLYFLAGGNLKSLFVLAGLGAIFLVVAVATSSYRWQRVQTFLNPSQDPQGSGFHIRQITLALGRGGWFGQGIGNSRQKYSYIPEASTDSIFAIIAEEVGYVGSVVLLGLVGLHLALMVRLAQASAPGSFEWLLGWGIVVWVAGQTLLNLSAVVALIPLTGVPMPFFSYGGTALVMVLFATGVLLRVNAEQRGT